MNKNYGEEFTEQKYATKDDVRVHFNVSSVDYWWQQVVDYRKNMTTTLELPSIDMTKFSLVFTKNITNRLLLLERQLTSSYMAYSKLTPEGQASFRKLRMSKIVHTIVVSVGAEKDVSDAFISAMIDHNVSTIPTDLLAADNYLQALDYLASHDAGSVSYTDFNMLNEIINTGIVPNHILIEKNYRKTEIEEPHYYQHNFVYKAATLERIDAMMDSLSAFISDSSQFALVRAMAALFYSDYIMPYDFLKEENSCLAFKLSLARGGFASFSTFVDIESLVMIKDEHFNQVKETVQKTLDLTFFVDYVLDFLKDSVSDIFDDIALAEKEQMSYEAKNVGLSLDEKDKISAEAEPELLGTDKQKDQPSLLSETVKSLVSNYSAGSQTGQAANNNSVANSADDSRIQIYGQQAVALPIFPQGLEEKDIQNIVTNLVETFPTLKNTQAHFYASHCTIGKAYTIQQFKKSELTSYETARTSMDYLSQLGFYEKSKIRNKFVYKPIPRR